jgi:hypothetical protein
MPRPEDVAGVHFADHRAVFMCPIEIEIVSDFRFAAFAAFHTVAWIEATSMNPTRTMTPERFTAW